MFTRKRRWSALGAAVLATALALTGCTTMGGGGEETPAADVPQELRYVPGFFPVSLDTHNFPAEEGVQVAIQQVLETLVTFDGTEAQPRLAESWEYVDDTTLTFTLRDDVTFSDGTPFTANDVKASLDRVIELKKALAPLFAAVTETRVDDDTHFTIVTSEPLGTLVGSMSLVFIGKADSVALEEYWLAPIGTGPFVVTEYVADDHVNYVRNDDYWGEPATLETLDFVNIPEVASKITALQTGEVDVVSTIPPDQVGNVEGVDDIVFEQKDSFLYYFIWFNENREPYNNPLIRQAMWHAVDVESIVSDLYGDGATAAGAPYAQSVFGATQQDQLEYDPELARDLLAEAGYPDGFSASIQWPREGGPNIKALAQAFISAWAEVGIVVEPLEKERAKWLEDFGALEWDLNLQTNSTPTGDADFTLNRLYTCAAKRMGYCNPELDALLAQARASLDQEERADLYAEANEIMWEDVPGIFPADLKANIAYRSDVQGLVLPSNNRPDFSTVSIGAGE